MSTNHDEPTGQDGPAAALPAGSHLPGEPGARRSLPVKLLVFLVLLVILLIYTRMAFQLEWVTKAGRIGPGFFPRIIGVLGSALAALATVQAWRNPADESEGFEEEDQGEADLGRHPTVLLGVVLASAVFLVTFNTLGAIVSGAIFCFAVLAYLNRGQWVVNAVLAIAVPLALYLLFQTALNAGLPSGILPRF